MITVRRDGRVVAVPTAGELRSHRPGEGLFWVDVVSPDQPEVELLAQGFGLHPLVLEDLANRNQRPKVDEYSDYLFVVLFGAVRLDEWDGVCLGEVHVLVGDGYVATVCDETIPALRGLADQVERRPELASGDPALLLYRVCDALVDSVFPILDGLEESIEAVETDIVEHPDAGTVQHIFTLKRDLNVLRRVLGPERDLLQSLAGPRSPRLGGEAQPYLRDVYDHIVRIVEQVDSYRDFITSALDVYLSSVSNRLGEQTRRLTVVATVFLPLTFLTGFFGMNFGALVAAIATPRALVVGLLAMAVSAPAVYLAVQHLTSGVRPVPPPPRQRRRGLRPRPRDEVAAAVTPGRGAPRG